MDRLKEGTPQAAMPYSPPRNAEAVFSLTGGRSGCQAGGQPPATCPATVGGRGGAMSYRWQPITACMNCAVDRMAHDCLPTMRA